MNVSRRVSHFKLGGALLGVAALAALGLGARLAHADTITTVDFPGATLTKARSVNDNGDVVGLFQDSTGATRGFERHADGTFSPPLVAPGDNQSYTRALGINDAGTIVGDFLNLPSSGGQTYHGYLLSGGAFTQFDVGGPFSTSIAAVNAAGDFAGSYGSDAQGNEAFLDVGGVLTEFSGPAGNTNTQALGLNAGDVVVGVYTDSGGTTHGFSRDPATGALTAIDVSTGGFTAALSINDAGTIAGYYQDANGVTHGYFDRGGVITTFDLPGSQYTTINSINNAGAFTGFYVDAGGVTHGYVDTPTSGASHVLWDNPDGKTIFWDVAPDGSHTVAGTYGPFADDASGSTNWTAVALSTGPNDVSHLLWTNPDGNTYLWTVQADGSFTPFLYGPMEDDGTSSTIWKAVAVSTGGDGRTHVLWSNPDGRTILWDVRDTDGSFTVVSDYDPQPGYTPAALASGADGLSHVLWNGAGGKALLWDLDAQNQPTAFTYGPFSDDGTSSTLWSARAISVGPDNVPHLLWTNPDGRTILWDVAADGGFTIPGTYGPFQDDASGSTGYAAVALATGADGLSHFAWDNGDGNTFLWSVNPDGSHADTYYPPFLDGPSASVWKAVAVSAAP